MTENMKQFLKKLSEDQELKKKAEEVKTKGEVIALAKELGVALTEEDFLGEDGREISEEELATAAGGQYAGITHIRWGGDSSQSSSADGNVGLLQGEDLARKVRLK